MTGEVRSAAQTTVGALFREQARNVPDHVAVEDHTRCWTYAHLNARVNRLAHALGGLGIGRGDRIGLLSENRTEFIEVELAAAKTGAIVAALNWRLTGAELSACMGLTGPKLLIVSEKFESLLRYADCGQVRIIALGDAYEALLSESSASEPVIAAQAEDGLLILFTSGTTGQAKGAVISHRALLCRGMVYRADLRFRADHCFPAWTPMFHMGATDPTLAMLLLGGRVIAIDGFDLDRLLHIVREQRVNWLVLMVGVVDRFIERARAEKLVPRGVRLAGVMPDLVPRHQIAEVTSILNAPFLNSFGSTETGLPPASGGFIAPGKVPERLSKRQSSYCEVRLVDADDREVPDGQPGELVIRGPTLFSGYWQAPVVNAREFRGGWFHMGDVFTRNADGTFDFVDRVKYLIKSGGENIYPAEIEQVLLADPGISDAVVVRQSDPHWGEVPVAVVVRRLASVSAADLMRRCEERLARYKRPKRIVFIDQDRLPRSFSGKVIRREVEDWLERQG